MEVDVHDRELTCPPSAPGIVFCLALAGISLSAAPALAFTLEVTHAGPSLVGEAHAFKAAITGASGAVTYEWKFGDGGDFQPGGAETSHAFAAPGFYDIDVMATDATGAIASR